LPFLRKDAFPSNKKGEGIIRPKGKKGQLLGVNRGIHQVAEGRGVFNAEERGNSEKRAWRHNSTK